MQTGCARTPHRELDMWVQHPRRQMHSFADARRGAACAQEQGSHGVGTERARPAWCGRKEQGPHGVRKEQGPHGVGAKNEAHSAA